ncbi:hypothetical protein HXT25_06285 [Gardnerella sp. DNF00476]|uniref:hypothetical protein n=1 Tax=Gardnerella sp. DNF00476 TaxID=2749047 RepID=UPI003BB14142
MKEDNNEYQDLNDIDSFNNPPEYEQDAIFDRSSNDSNRSLLSDKKAIAVIISISLTAVAIVIGIWLSLFAHSSSNINAGEPSKKCVQLRTQVLSAKANLKKIISSQNVHDASEIKSSDFDAYFDSVKDAVDDFQSSLNYAKDDLKNDILDCPVGASSYDSPSVENKFSNQLDTLSKDADLLKKSSDNLLKTRRTAFGDQLLNLVKKARELVEKAKDLPILAVASKSLENAINDAGNALAKSSNNYQELRQSYQKIKAVISQYEDRIKKMSDRFLSRDGNGYPFDAPHPQDDQGGYIPMGRSQNSESSEQNDQE